MIVAGTGHRPDKLGGYGAPAFNSLYQIAFMWLHRNKPTLVVSGMALGWDTALAKAAIDLKIPVTAAVPFEGQENNWPVASRIAYKHLLTLCSQIIIVTGGGYAAYKMQKRNEWMIRRITHEKDCVLLAMHDGSEGGTKNCLDYAKSSKKYDHLKIVNLYDEWKETTTMIF